MNMSSIEQLLNTARLQAESDISQDVKNCTRTIRDSNGDVDQEVLEAAGFNRTESIEISTVGDKNTSVAVTVRYVCAEYPRFHRSKTFARRCTLVMHSVNVAKTHNVKKLCKTENKDNKDSKHDELGHSYPQPGDEDQLQELTSR